MVYADPYDVATPSGDAPRSEGDDRIRELKRALVERLVTVIPNFPDGEPLELVAPDSWLTQGTLAARPNPPEAANLGYFATDTGELFISVTGDPDPTWQLVQLSATSVTKYAAHVQLNVDAAVAGAAQHVLSWGQSAVNVGGLWSSSVEPTRVTIPASLEGSLVVQLFAGISVEAESTTEYPVLVQILRTRGVDTVVLAEGYVLSGVATVPMATHLQCLHNAQASDYYQVRVTPSGNVNVIADAGLKTYFGLTVVS